MFRILSIKFKFPPDPEDDPGRVLEVLYQQSAQIIIVAHIF